MTFIGDYRPTKRVGIEELDGCIKLLTDKLDETAENGEMSTALYMGALIALETMRNGRFEYPQDFMAVFDNRVRELEGD
jgi:hypothetical protein